MSEVRWKQRFSNLENVWIRLQSACKQDTYSELELAGLIQTFEFTFELSWKTMKDLLTSEGYEVLSPRETIRQAFVAGIIQDPETWLTALESRNRLTHTYDKRTAGEAEQAIKSTYAPLIKTLVEKLRERL